MTKVMEAYTVAVKDTPVDDIVPNAFNPNEMDDAEYQALLLSLKEVGQQEPIVVRSHPTEEGKLEIVNGFRRWKAAKGLGWKYVKAQVIQMSDDKARVYCYTVSKIHGDVDPLKEAHFFGEEVKKGLNHKEIAAKYGVSADLVDDRLGIAELKEPIVKDFTEAINAGVDNTEDNETPIPPRGGIKPTVSQLEVLGSLKTEEEQRDLIGRIKAQVEEGSRDGLEGPPTVVSLQEEATAVKAIYEAKKKLEEFLAGVKVKECPKCKGKADTKGNDKDGLVVGCGNWHFWNKETGQLTDTFGMPQLADDIHVDAKIPPPPKRGKDWFLTDMKEEELRQLLVGRATKVLIPTLSSIRRIIVQGERDGQPFEVTVGRGEYGSSQGYEEEAGEFGGIAKMRFYFETKEYKKGAKLMIKAGYEVKVPDVQAFIEALQQGKEPDLSKKSSKKAKDPVVEKAVDVVKADSHGQRA